MPSERSGVSKERLKRASALAHTPESFGRALLSETLRHASERLDDEAARAGEAVFDARFEIRGLPRENGGDDGIEICYDICIVVLDPELGDRELVCLEYCFTGH
jgi:hypothetical protein